MYTDSELQEIIDNGENSAIEFKTIDVRASDLEREMIAFSNSQGGVILLGINDDGVASGLTNDSEP